MQKLYIGGGMLDKNHRFYRLSGAIDWRLLEDEITGLLHHQHQEQWRLVSGSIYLKSFYDLSTEEVIKRWSECPYLRFFCTGDTRVEPTRSFPLSLEELEQLSLELEGQGYEVMIKALNDFRLLDVSQPESSSMIH